MLITMSEIENQDSPTKEEKMDESDSENSSDVKSEEPSPAKEEKTKPPEKSKIPEKSKTSEKSKTPVKKEEKKQEEEEESEDDDDPPLGLLEQPVILTSGKREKKKVERLSMSVHLPNSERKKVDIQEGAGIKLGDCPRIEFKLGHTKAMDLKPLHRVLFVRAGSNNEVKKNIRQFSGFTFGKGDKEFDKRLQSLNKMTLPQLKKICEILDVERGGTKQAIVERIMDFLFKPHSSGLKVPQKKKRRSKSAGDGEKKGAKRKRTSKKDTKGKSKKDTVSDISDSDEDEEDGDGDEEKEEKEEEAGGKSESEVEESEEEEQPPKKKAKVEKKKEPVKKENAKTKKQNGKQEKAPKKEKKESKKKGSNSEDGDSDDEPLAGKKDEPPSNDELKDVIKKILEGANLEEVTMKTVVKQVYEKYPSYDLTDRKDFIKATVKQIIS